MPNAKTVAPREVATEKMQAVRDLIAGPQIRSLEEKVEKLSRQVEQLLAQQHGARNDYNKKLEQAQAEFEARAQAMVQRAARHRARTTLRLKHLAHEMQKIAKQFAVEHDGRAAFARKMASLARQLRAMPAPPQLNLSGVLRKSRTARKKSKTNTSHGE